MLTMFVAWPGNGQQVTRNASQGPRDAVKSGDGNVDDWISLEDDGDGFGLTKARRSNLHWSSQGARLLGTRQLA
jgi:hypothetical protein